jgi:hypothetical protein
MLEAAQYLKSASSIELLSDLVGANIEMTPFDLARAKVNFANYRRYIAGDAEAGEAYAAIIDSLRGSKAVRAWPLLFFFTPT